MYVGIMRNFKNPTRLVKLTSLISQSYGFDIIYIRPKDVNIEKGTVKGKVLIQNEWHEKEVEIPPFIDISKYTYKKRNRDVTDYLKEQTFLSDNREGVVTKLALQEHLKNDSSYSHLVIPSFEVKEFKDLQRLSESYTKFVLKPSKGSRGRGIYILEKDGEKFSVGYNTEEKVLDVRELEVFFEEEILNKNYVLQKYVSSRTKQGDPFDCRIHVEKNHEGKWEIAKNYIRIGIGQKVISNVNQGGGIANPKPFLQANYGEQWTEINKKLNDLAVTLPYKFEQLRGTHIMNLGMDVGIGEDGELYLFEVNDAPSTNALVGEVAYLRSSYYKYILQEKLGILKETQNIETEKFNKIIEDREKIDKKNKSLLKELDGVKKELHLVQKSLEELRDESTKIKNSTSWRLTTPIRKLGSLKKQLKQK